MLNIQSILLIIFTLVIGIILGGLIAYTLIKIERKKLLSEIDQKELEFQDRIGKLTTDYIAQISDLKISQQKEIEKAREDSSNISRYVNKANMAQMMAAILPGFKHLPADCRFLGDPIDYIVFNGYTEIKDHAANNDVLEIILLEIKQGNASLNKTQKAIKEAVDNKKVRFEEMRISGDGKIIDRDKHAYQDNKKEKSTSVKLNNSRLVIDPNKENNPAFGDIRKVFPYAYMPWSIEEDETLRQMVKDGKSIHEMIDCLKRNHGAIASRIKKIGID